MVTSEFQKIASYALEVEALHFKSILEDNGIPAFVGGANANTVLSYVGTALGGVNLFVRTSDAVRAAEIISPLRDESDSHCEKWFCGNCDEEVDAGFQVCWSCGQVRAKAEQASRPAANTNNSEVEANDKTEDTLRRAWNASLIGLVTLPIILHLYSIYLLLSVAEQGAKCSPQCRRLIYQTIAANMFAGVVLFAIFFAPYYFS